MSYYNSKYFKRMLRIGMSQDIIVPTTKQDWENILKVNDIPMNRLKVWASAKLIRPTPVTYSSDKTKYHSMTIANGTIVDIGEMPDALGSSYKWCVMYRRTKGYTIAGFYSTEKAKLHFQSIVENGDLNFASAANQRYLTNQLISVLMDGVRPLGKTLNPSGVSSSFIETLKKELL